MNTVRNRSAILAMLLRAAEQSADWGSVVQVAKELEAVAMERETEGPSDTELLEWVIEHSLEIDSGSGFAHVRWTSDGDDDYWTAGADYRVAIRKAMVECAALEAIDNAPDPVATT